MLHIPLFPFCVILMLTNNSTKNSIKHYVGDVGVRRKLRRAVCAHLIINIWCVTETNHRVFLLPDNFEIIQSYNPSSYTLS